MDVDLKQDVDKGKITKEEAASILAARKAFADSMENQIERENRYIRQSRNEFGEPPLNLHGAGHRTLRCKSHQSKSRPVIRSTKTPKGEAEYGTRIVEIRAQLPAQPIIKYRVRKKKRK